MVEDSFEDVTVEGEISNFKRHRNGHLYFSLKDSDSQLPVVMFQGNARRLRFEPGDGQMVVARGMATIYEGNGQYQLLARWLKPAGLGALQLAFEKLKERLRADGWFEQERKRPLPWLPRHIGVVTSPSGAAIRDILRVLDRRFGNVRVTLYPARVQGVGASDEVAEGIRHLGRYQDVDVIIAGRGGGSMEDLWAFNEEVVARAIFESPVPVISAVGHEVDFTIADFVADVRAATPSAAAELVVASKVELARRLSDLRSRLATCARGAVEARRSRLARLVTHRALERPRSRLSSHRQRVDELSGRAELHLRQRLARLSDRRRNLAGKVRLLDPRRSLRARREGTAALRKRLIAAGRGVPSRQRNRCRELVQNLGHLSPLSVLERGYAIVRAGSEPEAAVVRAAREVRAGQALHVRLHEGAIQVRVAGDRPRTSKSSSSQPGLFDDNERREEP